VEDTTTLPAVTLLMITMSVVTPAEEAMSCLKLLSSCVSAASGCVRHRCRTQGGIVLRTRYANGRLPTLCMSSVGVV
jgi:hypothetical protein